MDEVQFKKRIDQIYSDLDRYSYYELLNLTPQALPDAIRAAFHRMALSVHPDRHQYSDDTDLREKVYAIYKRIAEGYRVLMDAESRKEYDEGLSQGQWRLNKVERKKSGPQREEATIDHPQAKKFFLLALDAERRGDLKGARLNYKFALDLVGEHPTIKEHLQRLEKESGVKR